MKFDGHRHLGALAAVDPCVASLLKKASGGAMLLPDGAAMNSSCC
jgi:hypothetical protein